MLALRARLEIREIALRCCQSPGQQPQAFRRHRSEEEETRVTEAKFTFVAIDDAGKPRAVDG